MARVEHEREDLLREATALRERVALVVPGFSEPITCGFRDPAGPGSVSKSGGLSLYFGQDPAYHFDGQGHLRRAFAQDCLYRSQGSTLARLTRVRTEQETVLSRYDLSPVELNEFLTAMLQHLRGFFMALVDDTVVVQAQVPAVGDVRPRLKQALEQIVNSPLRLAPSLK